jgi:hypothetical protein
LTDIEITENILLLLLAGHDTSSTTLTRMLSVLHEHPHVVQQLRQEQAAVMARHGEQLTAAAIKDMEYADAVIRCGLWFCACWVSAPACGCARCVVRCAQMPHCCSHQGHRVCNGSHEMGSVVWQCQCHTAIRCGMRRPGVFNMRVCLHSYRVCRLERCVVSVPGITCDCRQQLFHSLQQLPGAKPAAM